MAASAKVPSGAVMMRGLLSGPQANIYLASKPSVEDRRILLDFCIPVKTLIHFSGYFRDALKVVTEASEESVIATAGPHEHGREISFAPVQTARGSCGLIDITIICGDTLAEEAFKIVFCWMLNTCKSGETEKISDQLTFIDLTHCMMVNELLALPAALKDQVSCLLARTADNQFSLEDVQTLYARITTDHPTRSMMVEKFGKAYLQGQLKDWEANYNYSHDNEEFQKDFQQFIHKHRVSSDANIVESSAFIEDQTLAGIEPDDTDGLNVYGGVSIEGSAANCSPPTAVVWMHQKTCGNEILKYPTPTYVASRILSFDGPTDEWSNPVSTSGNEWSQGASEWHDTAVSAGGYEDGWGNTAGGSSTKDNDDVWGDDVERAGGATGGDDNACRRCKQPGHFARECPEPRDDSCFNCGQPGHIARDCTEPKKPRGGDRACHKCNEVGHIARDCPTGGGGGDRACHKCGETGHIARECTSSGFGAAAGGGGNGMQCYNCQQFGHKSSECTNEPVERQYGSDPRTCNKCGQKGHISRDCREDGGDTYAEQHGGDDHGEQYDARYGSGTYDGRGGLYDSDAGIEESVEPVREEMINVTVSATRVRKGRRGRLGYVDITQQMYDPRAFDEPRYEAYSRGGQRREGGGRGGRGGRAGRGGRGGVRGPHDDGGAGGHGEEFTDENVPPTATVDVPAVAVEGDWADAGGSSAPASSAW